MVNDLLSHLVHLLIESVTWGGGFIGIRSLTLQGREIMQILFANGNVLGVVSWTTGFVPVAHRHKVLSEDDILAHALWLEKHGHAEDAVDFLDAYVEGVQFPAVH